MPDSKTANSAYLAGARIMLPLTVGTFPFGVVFGLAAVEAGIDPIVSGAASTIMLAGAAQLAMVDLVKESAPWAIVILTALVINLRFMLYSGALAPAFREFPRRWRYTLPYLMTDQASSAALLHFDTEEDPVRRRQFFIGAGAPFAASWMAGTWVGVMFGARIPESWQLGFAVPLMFLSLVIPSITNRPKLVAAVAATAAVVLLRGLPFNLAIIIGALVGIGAGLVADR